MRVRVRVRARARVRVRVRELTGAVNQCLHPLATVTRAAFDIG